MINETKNGTPGQEGALWKAPVPEGQEEGEIVPFPDASVEPSRDNELLLNMSHIIHDELREFGTFSLTDALAMTKWMMDYEGLDIMDRDERRVLIKRGAKAWRAGEIEPYSAPKKKEA